MENAITEKRGLILALIIATVVVFVALVWLISNYAPWNRPGFSNPGNPESPARVEKNCTYPLTYWKEHPELYPPQVIIGSRIYQPDEILETLTGADLGLVSQFQAQMISVFLNGLSGADQSLIEPVLFQAYDWIIQHPHDNQLTDSERETGSRISNVLEAYNLGLAGVPLCPDSTTSISTGTPSLTWTPTSILTSTPTLTDTAIASATSSPASQPTSPVRTLIEPTQTPRLTTEEPHPTNTPVPPTQAPTSTQAPPPAPTDTQAQPPTITPPVEEPTITPPPP